jgi:DNA-binding NarL/FixJ family response regulator
MIEILAYAVDDDVNIVTALEKKLKDVVTLYTFTSEYQMLRALNSNVQICIVDHYLKDSTGLQVIRKVREQLPYCKFIILSGQTENRILIEYINEKVSGYVDKGEKDAMHQVVTHVRLLLPEIKHRLLLEELTALDNDAIQAVLKKYE